jgi:hypothetical protein
MEEMTVSNRVKSSCEILEIATLVAHFTFDNGSFLLDSGPNSLPAATTQSTSSVSSGRFSQAVHFNGSNSTYFQMYGFYSLGIINKPFSISLWIRPTSLLGIIVHVSSSALGNGWCLPFLAFATNGSLGAQIYNGSVISVVAPTSSVSTLVWSHVVETWSPPNGLRLYINNVLVASLGSAVAYSGNSVINYITLGNTLIGPTECLMGVANDTAYTGDMDDFRVYSRELSASDVCTLYTNTN